DRELVVEPSVYDLLRGGRNRPRPAAGEQPQLACGLGRAPLDEAEGADEAAREGLAGDREVEDGALRRGAVVGVHRDLHLAHRVALRARCLLGCHGFSLCHSQLRRLAAVDIGSNTVPVLVADVVRGQLVDVAHYVEMPELGPQVARTGSIGSRGKVAITALRHVLAEAATHGYQTLVAGATEAVRQATDGEQ